MKYDATTHQITVDSVPYQSDGIDGRLVLDPPVVIPVEQAGEFFYPMARREDEWTGVYSDRYRSVDEAMMGVQSQIVFMWSGIEECGDGWCRESAPRWRELVTFVPNP